MSETTTQPETFEGNKLSYDSAYEQLVGFQEASRAYVKAENEEDLQGQLDAANKAVSGAIRLVNEFMPADVSDKLHARLAEEHPELAPEPAPDIEAILRSLGLLGDDEDQEG